MRRDLVQHIRAGLVVQVSEPRMVGQSKDAGLPVLVGQVHGHPIPLALNRCLDEEHHDRLDRVQDDLTGTEVPRPELGEDRVLGLDGRPPVRHVHPVRATPFRITTPHRADLASTPEPPSAVSGRGGETGFFGGGGVVGGFDGDVSC
ncbi:hypothetical protein EAO73_14780 [Streptomyces sp. col6]|nr:hypothetical protein EAO73_14780 [Streptomyces sp. col6]